MDQYADVRGFDKPKYDMVRYFLAIIVGFEGYGSMIYR
jgi:hypothetical protein